MASRSVGVGNDPAISKFRAPDYRALESASFNESRGGVPNRVGFAGARGYKSAGFGGYETGPDGNLQIAGAGTSGASPMSDGSTVSPTAGTGASFANPFLDTPRPPSAANSLLAAGGARLAGEGIKALGKGLINSGGDIPKPGGGIINPLTGAETWPEASVVDGQQTASPGECARHRGAAA